MEFLWDLSEIRTDGTRGVAVFSSFVRVRGVTNAVPVEWRRNGFEFITAQDRFREQLPIFKSIAVILRETTQIEEDFSSNHGVCVSIEILKHAHGSSSTEWNPSSNRRSVSLGNSNP